MNQTMNQLINQSINQSSHPWMENRIFAAEVSQNTKNAFLRWRERWKSVLPTLGGSVIFAVCDTSAARIPSPKQSFQSRGVAKVPNFASHARREHWKNYASCLAWGSFFVLLRHLSSKNAKSAGIIAKNLQKSSRKVRKCSGSYPCGDLFSRHFSLIF